MNVTIIPVDKLVIVNGRVAAVSDVSGIPAEVHALQWDGTHGFIEYNQSLNVRIDELPAWAVSLVAEHSQVCAAEDAEIAAALAYASSPEGKAEVIRNERDGKLMETDWWELPSQVPISVERAEYRQALRDITSQATFPDSVEWPVKP